jgi:hypothetical protein
MHNQPNIFWLASFPKSGNTWIRIFINTIRSGKDQKNQTGNVKGSLDLNQLKVGTIASDRQWVEDILGFDIGDLSQEEIDLLRPGAYEWYSGHIDDIFFAKVHDAYRILPDGTSLFPTSCIRGVLYIVRNPLDICVSLADHLDCTIDDSIAHMASPDFSLAGNYAQLDDQLRQIISSWSWHADSWLKVAGINRMVVRYEDLHRDQLTTFTRIAEFLELDSDPHLVRDTLDRIQFKTLRELESNGGFREAATHGKHFFRRGLVGDWQSQLDPDQVARLITDHADMMQHFGYLDNSLQLTDLVCAKAG